MPERRLLFVVAADYFFVSHRLPLALAAQRAGFQVHVATPPGEKVSRIEDAGFLWHPLRMERRETRMATEYSAYRDLAKLIREVRPEIVHLVGHKPILLGTLAARRAKTPRIVCAVAGLGAIFLSSTFRGRILQAGVVRYYRWLINGRADVRVIVQNVDDRQFLLDQRMARDSQIRLIPGMGIDLETIRPAPREAESPVVLYHGRLLWDKGLGELIEAARILRRRGTPARFVIAGDLDLANPAAISANQRDAWKAEGIAEFLGQRTDILELLHSAQVACLPSYREGAPLALIEAAGAGLPIVTTDVPGCREVVAHGENGLLVPPRDAPRLADALATLLNDPVLRRRFAVASRLRAEKLFSQDRVFRETLAIYDEPLTRNGKIV